MELQPAGLINCGNRLVVSKLLLCTGIMDNESSGSWLVNPEYIIYVVLIWFVLKCISIVIFLCKVIDLTFSTILCNSLT